MNDYRKYGNENDSSISRNIIHGIVVIACLAMIVIMFMGGAIYALKQDEGKSRDQILEICKTVPKEDIVDCIEIANKARK